MEKSLFEQMGGTYREEGDYFIPNLALLDTEARPIGFWGQRRRRYLKEHHRVLYYNLLTSGKLNAHLADIDEQAEEMFSRLVNDHAVKEGITEQLKADDAMAWVQKMNNIRSSVTEMIYKELIYHKE